MAEHQRWKRYPGVHKRNGRFSFFCRIRGQGTWTRVLPECASAEEAFAAKADFRRHVLQGGDPAAWRGAGLPVTRAMVVRPPTQGPELAQAVERWERSYTARSGAQRPSATTRAVRDHILTFFGPDRRAGTIDHEDLQRLFLHLGDETDDEGRVLRVGNTLRRYYTTFRAFFEWLLERGSIGANPMSRVRRPKGGRRHQVEPLTHEEARAALRRWEFDPVLGPFVWIARFTGARPSEIRFILGRDRDRSAGTIGIPWCKSGPVESRNPATKTRRKVPEHPTLTEYLDRCPILPNKPILQHRNRHGGRGLNHGLYVTYESIANRLDFAPNRMRHLFATEYLQRTPGDYFGLARIMGTSPLMLQQTYVHLLEEDTRERIGRLRL